MLPLCKCLSPRTLQLLSCSSAFPSYYSLSGFKKTFPKFTDVNISVLLADGLSGKCDIYIYQYYENEKTKQSTSFLIIQVLFSDIYLVHLPTFLKPKPAKETVF